MSLLALRRSLDEKFVVVLAKLEVRTEAVWRERGWGLVARWATLHSLKNTITKTKHHSIMEEMLTGLPSSLTRSYFPPSVLSQTCHCVHHQ